jgi:hypothetical protein
MHCPKCESPFDLKGRAPIMHSCCIQVTCKACWNESFNIMDEFDCFFHCGKPSRENHDEPKISAAMRREIEEKEMQFEVPESSLWEEQEECKMLH